MYTKPFLKFFNWRINALHYCVGFCCTTVQISHNYIHTRSLGSLPPRCPSRLSECSAIFNKKHIKYYKKTYSNFLNWFIPHKNCLQFSSVAQSCPTLCDPMNRSMPGLPVHHQLPEFTQTHVHQVGDVIQPSHPLSSPSPPAPNPSQHQGFFQWVSPSHQVAKVLEFQLQHQSFQWTPRTDLL